MSWWWLMPLSLAAVTCPVLAWLAATVRAERRACAAASAALADLRRVLGAR